jgi:tRNA A-37 threonylcarbamoyl transferase component Bud32
LAPGSATAGSATRESAAASVSSGEKTAQTTTAQTIPTTAFEPSVPVLEHHEILGQIGAGGFGVIYKARDKTLNRFEAIKLLRCGALDAERAGRFEREAHAMARLDHPHIVPVFARGEYRGEPYYIMPFMPGGSMSGHKEELRKDPRRAVAVLIKVARAVQYLHEQGIVHRDLKPQNVLFAENGEPHVSDFGLAKLLDDDQSLSATNQRLGTPAYMAPEQTGLLTTKTGPQTDIWSLGVLLYELVAGVRPFQSDDDKETATLLAKIIKETPVRPSKLKPDLDRGLEAVILKCLEKNPHDRFASAAELADELGRWLRQEKVQTRRTPVRRFVYRWRWVAAAFAFVAVAATVVAAVAAIVARRNSPEFILEALRNEFLQNGTIELVRDKTAPRWHALAMDAEVDTSFTSDGYWQIQSVDYGFVELLRDIPVDSYKLRAEIAHTMEARIVANKGYVGAFIAQSARSNERATPRFSCQVTFNDIVGDERPGGPKKGDLPGNIARFGIRVFAHAGGTARIDDYLVDQASTRFKRSDAWQPEWRTIELELRPGRIEGSFDGKNLEPWDRADAERRLQDWLRQRQTTKDPLPFIALGDPGAIKLSARGSLGLVVVRGAIAVKSVTLTRLNNP